MKPEERWYIGVLVYRTTGWDVVLTERRALKPPSTENFLLARLTVLGMNHEASTLSSNCDKHSEDADSILTTNEGGSRL
jgi:hypothetical protein